MLKKCFSILTLLFVGTATYTLAQAGLIKESLTIDSEILDKQVEYSVYLPSDYQDSNREYPVLYLLHGFTDDETAWTQFGEVKNIADREFQKVTVTPMIIVMPDAGVSWYINSKSGDVRYEDFFIDEFMPSIEQQYRIRDQKRYRGIAGLSMGGYGTLIMAFKHPDLFAAAAPLSAGITIQEDVPGMPQERWDDVFGVPFGKDLKGDNRLSDHYREHSILHLANTIKPEQLRGVRYYIDCGDDDFLIEGNMELHRILSDRDIEHEFRVRDGAHTWTYWRQSLPTVLEFVSQSFHQY